MRRTKTPVFKSVELSNRVKLPYVEQGDPSGVPAVFLHGASIGHQHLMTAFL
jgi:hypothetical protein